MKRRAVFYLLLLPLVGLACVLFAGHRLTLRTSPQEAEPDRLPTFLIEPLSIVTRDGIRLGAWWFPRGKTDCTVVLLHGYGGRRSYEIEHINLLYEIGCHVLAPTLRSHGDSDGERTYFGRQERLDVIAAVETAEQLAPESRIFVFGRSLGAASAMLAAEELGNRVNGYVLESPFEDLEIATKNRIGFILPQAFVDWVYLPLGLTAPLFLEATPAEIAPIDGARTIEQRVLLLSGDLDVHATPLEAQHIEAAIKDVQHERFAQAAHDGLLSSEPVRYAHVVQAWLQPKALERSLEVGPALGPGDEANSSR